jgi:hypothetical protein
VRCDLLAVLVLPAAEAAPVRTGGVPATAPLAGVGEHEPDDGGAEQQAQRDGEREQQ